MRAVGTKEGHTQPVFSRALKQKTQFWCGPSHTFLGRPWIRHLAFLGLCFFICLMGVMITALLISSNKGIEVKEVQI